MVKLYALDYILIILFFSITLFIGIFVSKKAGKNTAEYFLSGRNSPWWLLGLSMVATTFSTDTPNLVTDIVRSHGVSGNWVWWVFLITGLLTVFVYAKLWRKSNVTTDMEFYELRYGGKPARFLRGFRSVYLGVFFNILAMSGVTLAAIKIGQVMLGLSAFETVGYAGIITVIFSAIGGFKGVVYTDFVLFFVAMIGAISAAYYIVNLPEVNGLQTLVTHPNVVDKLSFFPKLSNKDELVTLLIIPLAVQWWSAWYPGAEPGGGGYIAQRMLAAKNENHAIGATFFFNIMHYALRPWPWIIVALASLIVYPDLASLHQAFPNVSIDKLGNDLAYSAMLTKLPSGLLGLVLASLSAAYMSTISTHLNWGSSYIVNDFYKEFFGKEASEKKLVFVGRIATVLLMIFSAILALYLQNAMQLFNIIIGFGAGTGLLFILRWFWWRINAWSEITAMFVSGIISVLIELTPLGNILFDVHGIFEAYYKFPFIVLVTTLSWIFVTLITKPEKKEVLFTFYKKIQPGGIGWSKVIYQAENENIILKDSSFKWTLPKSILAIFVGLILIFSILFATGNLLYGNYQSAILLLLVVIITSYIMVKIWKQIKSNVL